MTPKEKYKICHECEHLKKRMCNLCGCFMPAKVIIPFSVCPINKWSNKDDI